MSKTPPTFGTHPDLHSGIDWDDPAAFSRRDDGA